MHEVAIVDNASINTTGGCYIVDGQGSITYSYFKFNYCKNGSGLNLNDSKMHISDCRIDSNFALILAGGLKISGDSSIVERTTLCGNIAEDNGGAIYASFGGHTTFRNCLFSNNTSNSFGGVAMFLGSSASFYNITATGNSANFFDGIFSSNSSISIVNSIVAYNGSNLDTFNSGTIDVSHSLIEGGWHGTNILDTLPYFTDTSSKDYTLLSNSPAINAGSNDSLSIEDEYDIDGNPRIHQCLVDMGAYEYQGYASGVTKWYVDSSNVDGVCTGTNWASAFSDFQDALDAADAGDTICIAKGTYYPSALPRDCPDCDSTRDVTFHLKDSVVYLGGYPSGGGSRKWEMYPTILSGDIGVKGDSSDNAYHVLIAKDLSSQTLFDGIIVERGFANGPSFILVEGGSILRFYGGGMYIREGSMHISNCQFRRNRANILSGAGGAIHTDGDGSITHCVFYKNAARTGGGLSQLNSGTHYLWL